MRRKLPNRSGILRKTGKGFEPRLASRTLPEVTNNSVIQKLRIAGCDDFMIAPNTVDSEHLSFRHRGSLASRDP
jgi:hypothetical protein